MTKLGRECYFLRLIPRKRQALIRGNTRFLPTILIFINTGPCRHFSNLTGVCIVKQSKRLPSKCTNTALTLMDQAYRRRITCSSFPMRNKMKIGTFLIRFEAFNNTNGTDSIFLQDRMLNNQMHSCCKFGVTSIKPQQHTPIHHHSST